MTPDGLTQMASLVQEIAAEPGVRELLTPTDPIVAPSALIMALLQVDGFGSVTQTEIDNLRGPPELLAALDAMTGNRQGRHTDCGRLDPAARHGR